MAWFVVPALDALRLQLNAAFPGRDRTSDGAKGNELHAVTRSSHNPDKSGLPEYADGDAFDEVRARDFDNDLNHPGITAEHVVQHLLAGARAGRFWWLRYLIYNRRIWTKSSGWKRAPYTGASPHDHHFHVNTDYTQAADTVTDVDYRLQDLIKGNDMDQKDALTAKTSVNGRTVGNVLGDVSNLRDWLIVTNPAGVPTPPEAGSPLGQLFAMAKAFPSLVAQVAAIRTGVERDDVDEAAIAAAVLRGMDYKAIAAAVTTVLPKDQVATLLDALAARLQA